MTIISNAAGDSSSVHSRVFFAFGDGDWTYDCASCGATCCKGFSYLLRDGREYAAHVGTHAAVQVFLHRLPDQGRWVGFRAANFKPGCFMLQADRRCGIHAERGYGSKPEACRLFPFNFARRVGDVLVVAPHPSLCPLTLADPPGSGTRHDALLGEMRSIAGGFHVVEARCATDLATTIEIERRIRDMSPSFASCDSYETFVLAQIGVARDLVGQERRTRDRETLGSIEHCNEMSRVLRATLECWPTQEHDRDPDVIRLMVAMTPVLRSHILFPEPRESSIRWPDPLLRLPYCLLTLQKLVSLCREAGMGSVTYQTVMGLLGRYGSLCRVGACLDVRMTLSYERRIDLTDQHTSDVVGAHASFLRAVRALVDGLAPEPVGAILARCCGAERIGRLAVLEEVSRRLHRHLTPSDRARARGLRRLMTRLALRAPEVQRTGRNDVSGSTGRSVTGGGEGG